MGDEEKKAAAQFMTNWRNSEFYEFVLAVINAELKKSYVQDVMTQRIMHGEPMDNDEIANEMRLEVKSNLRIQSILDVIK